MDRKQLQHVMFLNIINTNKESTENSQVKVADDKPYLELHHHVVETIIPAAAYKAAHMVFACKKIVY